MTAAAPVRKLNEKENGKSKSKVFNLFGQLEIESGRNQFFGKSKERIVKEKWMSLVGANSMERL